MEAILAAVCDAGSVEARLDALAAWKVRISRGVPGSTLCCPPAL